MTSTPVVEERHNVLAKQNRRLAKGKTPSIRTNRDVEDYNRVIHALAAKRGLNLLDLHRVIQHDPHTNIGADGVHLSRAGEDAAAGALAQTLKGWQRGGGLDS